MAIRILLPAVSVVFDKLIENCGVRPNPIIFHVARNQGQTHAGNWLHAEAFQYGNVAVAAADEYEVLNNGLWVRFHIIVSFVQPDCPSVSGNG
jgi:hypothetical protein